MKAAKFPVTITEKDMSAIICESMKFKDGGKHRYFIIEYIHFGKRKQVWRSGPVEARTLASEARRDWMKRNSIQLPKITVAEAIAQLQRQAVTDGKSPAWLKQLANVLDQLAESFVCDVHTLTPKLIGDYLTAMTLAEKSKRITGTLLDSSTGG